MANAFDQFDAPAPSAAGNPFDQFDQKSASNPFDQFDHPAVDLSHIKAVPGNMPSVFSSGMPGGGTPSTLNPDWDFTMATAGNPVFAATGAALDAANRKVVEPLGAWVMNQWGRLVHAGQGLPPTPTNVQPGQELIPPPPENDKGVGPAVRRAASGFSTPGSILGGVVAPESKAAQAWFALQSSAGIPGAIQNWAEAQTPGESREALTDLTLQAAMAHLLGRQFLEAPKMETVTTSPPQLPQFKSPIDLQNAIAQLEVDPNVTGTKVVGLDPKTGNPITESVLIDQSKVRQLENLRALQAQGRMGQPPQPAAKTTSASGGFSAPKEEVVQPGQVAMTPDGKVDPVPTAINKLRQGETIPAESATKPPEAATKRAESETGQGEQTTAAPTPVVSHMPEWLREAMIQKGLDPARLFNDQDLQNPSVVEAIRNDPTLTDDQKQSLLTTGGLNKPLTPAPESAKTESAAPGTDTVRTAAAGSNESQRGQVPAAPPGGSVQQGVTAEGGSNPLHGAAPISTGASSAFRVGDRVVHEGEVKTVTKAIPGGDFIGVGNRAVPAKSVRLATPEEIRTGEAGESTPQSSGSGTFSQKAEQLAMGLDALKSGVKPGGPQMHLFGVAADLWDRAIDVAQKAIRAGGTVADAIDAAIGHIRDNFKEKWDESAARTWLEKKLLTPGRATGAIKQELAQAEEDLKAKTRAQTDATAGTQSERKQASAQAAARYRTLRDELSTHPDFVAEQILKQHQAITEANQILKPMGKTVSPEDFPNPQEVTAKLGEPAAKRVNELADQVAGAQAELAHTNRLAPKMVERITNEMMADGRLPKMAEIAPNAGRTLQAMTDALNKSVSDSPKVPWSERFNVAKKWADAYTAGKDVATKAWGNSVAASKALWSVFKSHPISEDFKAVMKSWIGYDTRTSVENASYARALVSKVPQKIRRQAMSVWLDADGDESLLKFQRDSVPEKYRSVWDAALKLTPYEKQEALRVKADFEHKLNDGINVGIINRGRADYGVPQRWKKAPETESGPDPEGESKRGKPGNPYAKLDPRDPFFDFQRHTASYFDGIMAKGEPENLDIGHLVSTYDEAFHKALSSRGAIRGLKDATAADGAPIAKFSGTMTVAPGEEGGIFVDSQTIPKDAVTPDGRPYVYVDHWALKDYKFAGKDPTSGRPVLVRGNMLVHPDYAERLRNELNTPRWMTKPVEGSGHTLLDKAGYYGLRASGYLKASKFVGPFHIVTEALHASFHGVVPSVHDFKLDLNDPKQALLSRNMMIDMGRAREMYDDGIRSAHAGIWGHVPGLGDAIVRMNNFTFNEYIPKLKMKVGLAVLERNMERYGKELSEDQIAEITGRQMDAAFGGQNWRLMGTNKTALGVARLAFVAPDFLLSRAKVIGQAFKPYNKEQRIFLIAQTVGVYTLCRALNSIFSDDHDPHFEGHNWDRVVIGKRSYGARFIVSDAANFARDFLGLGDSRQNGMPFISGRLGVIPKTGYEALMGRDLFTGQKAQGLWDSNPGVSRFFSIVAKDTAEWMTPMAVDGFIGGARKGQTGLGQVAAATLGVSSHKENATGQIWDMARQFNLNSKDPATVRYQTGRDNDSGRQSDYGALDNLLDAGDMKAAQSEYNRLKDDGRKPTQIAARYDHSLPFTGNRDREVQFMNSLTPEQRVLYQKARGEQQDRRNAFNRLAK